MIEPVDRPRQRLIKGYSWAALLLILLGAWLQGGMLAQNVRFHPDEALYATYAQRIRNGDFLLANVPLDKPPLGLALTAGSFLILGTNEFAARLPAFFASLLELASVYALARRLYNRQIAAIGTLLLVLSPMQLAFAATAFHDPLLTLCLLLACLFASRDHWRSAGLCAALAIATKQSSIEFLPVFLLIAISRLISEQSIRWQARRRRLWQFALPLILISAALALWSVARAAPTDFWTLGILNPGELRLIRSDEVGPRLLRWFDLTSNITGFGPLLALAVIPIAAAFYHPKVPRFVLTDLVIALGVLLVLLSYWLLAYNTYDRYVYPLGALILVLIARGITQFRQWRAIMLVVVACVTPFTVIALRGGLSIGGDHGTYTGIDRLAAEVAKLPPNAILYDFWLGWELGYYLPQAVPPGNFRARIIFEPTPEALARVICVTPGYFAAPVERSPRWLAVMRAYGINITSIYRDRFELYELDCGSF